MDKKIVAFGELLWDIFPDGKKLGGAPANLVYRVNALGDQGFLLSRVGNDKEGKEILEMMARMGISEENVQMDAVFPTGMATVKISPEGRSDYLIEPDQAFDHIEFTTEALRLVRDADCVSFGTLVQRFGISKNSLRELLKESPKPIKFLDLKLRRNCYTRTIIENSLQIANILRVKENELYILKNELSLFEFESRALSQEVLTEYDIDIILVTRGKGGVFAMTRDGVYIEDAGYKIKLVDTVGSGAAFSAGFLHIYLEEKDIVAALRFGNAAGALTAETHGATTMISKRQILEQMRSGERW